jgi:hypothetical protein
MSASALAATLRRTNAVVACRRTRRGIESTPPGPGIDGQVASQPAVPARASTCRRDDAPYFLGADKRAM